MTFPGLDQFQYRPDDLGLVIDQTETPPYGFENSYQVGSGDLHASSTPIKFGVDWRDIISRSPCSSRGEHEYPNLDCTCATFSPAGERTVGACLTSGNQHLFYGLARRLRIKPSCFNLRQLRLPTSSVNREVADLELDCVSIQGC